MAQNQYLRNDSLSQTTAPRPCLFTHSQSHTHNHTFTYTHYPVYCYDEVKGIQDLKIYSHADSLIPSLSQEFEYPHQLLACRTVHYDDVPAQLVKLKNFEEFVAACVDTDYEPSDLELTLSSFGLNSSRCSCALCTHE